MIKPLVSVCMITYNHEDYIIQAIEGVLAQQANFDIELVIGEDCSTDSTRAKIVDLVDRYPSKIILLEKTQNLGISANFFKTVDACRGKYIAICEGDDYWTDPLKLMKQVEFLEEHSEYTACAHQSMVIYQDKETDSHVFKENVSETLVMKDVISARPFHTASLLFKAELLKIAPLPSGITSCDRALFMLCAAFGPIKYINDPMCVYRKSSSGVSTWVKPEMLEKDLVIAGWMRNNCTTFPKARYLSFIHKTIIQYPKKVPLGMLLKHYFLYVYYSMSYFPRNLSGVAKFSIIHLPKIIFNSVSLTSPSA